MKAIQEDTSRSKHNRYTQTYIIVAYYNYSRRLYIIVVRRLYSLACRYT